MWNGSRTNIHKRKTDVEFSEMMMFMKMVKQRYKHPRELAESTGISESTVASWYRGGVFPSDINHKKLIKLMNNSEPISE